MSDLLREEEFEARVMVLGMLSPSGDESARLVLRHVEALVDYVARQLYVAETAAPRLRWWYLDDELKKRWRRLAREQIAAWWDAERRSQASVTDVYDV